MNEDADELPGMSRSEVTRLVMEIGKRLSSMPSRFDGQHWTPEHGWMPTSGRVQDEKPELNHVDVRPSDKWTDSEKQEYLRKSGIST